MVGLRSFVLLALLSVVLGCSHTDKPAAAGANSPPVDIPAGWIQYDASGLQLWAPASYRGGAPHGSELNGLVQAARTAGFADEALLLEQAQDRPGLTLLLVDVSGNGMSGTVEVVRQDVNSKATLASLADSATSSLPDTLRVLARQSERIGGQPAVKVLEVTNTDEKIAVYLLKAGSKAWTVSYAAPGSDFDLLMADFDRSSQTIRLLE